MSNTKAKTRIAQYTKFERGLNVMRSTVFYIAYIIISLFIANILQKHSDAIKIDEAFLLGTLFGTLANLCWLVIFYWTIK
jgi:hypothetical protein